MKSVFEQIIELLNRSKIEYTLTKHEAVRTSEEAAKVRNVEMKNGAKSMLCKTKDRFILLILPADKKINWKVIKKILHIKDIRFATEGEAEKITNVEMGSVPPFGNLFHIESYIDEHIFENEIIFFNPGSRTHTISMKSIDLKRTANPIITSFA